MVGLNGKPLGWRFTSGRDDDRVEIEQLVRSKWQPIAVVALEEVAEEIISRDPRPLKNIQLKDRSYRVLTGPKRYRPLSPGGV